MAKPRSPSSTDWVRFSLLVAAAVLLNIASLRFFGRVDLTRSRAFTLSEASIEALESLREPLTIKAYFTRNLPYPYNSIEQQTRDLFEEYGLRANRFFNYSVISLDAESEGSGEKASAQREEAQSYGIYPIQIQKVEQDQVKLQNAYLGMALIHGDMVETIPALTATDNLEFTVTRAIEKLSNKISALLAVEGAVSVTLYESASLEKVSGSVGNAFRAMPAKTQDLVHRLNARLFDKLAYAMVDPDAQADAAADAKSYSLMRLSLSSGQTAYASLVLSYKGAFRKIDLLQQGIFGLQVKSIDDLDETVEAATEALIGVNPGIGWVSDHGASTANDELSQLLGPQEEPSYANFRALLGESYSLQDVALETEDIPEGIHTLVIAGPARKFSDWELFKLDQFLMKGNSLAIFLDTHTQVVPQNQSPVYLPRDTGLDKLLEHWGVAVDKSYVLDEKSYVARQRDRSGSVQEVPVYFYPMIEKSGLDQKLAITRNLPLLYMINASPLRRIEGSTSGATVQSVVTSSPGSWEMKDNINLYNPWMLQPPAAGDASRGSRDLVYLIEGELTSSFAATGAPEPPPPKESSDASGAAAEASVSSKEIGRSIEVIPQTTSARVLLAGTSGILQDTVVDEAGSQPNATFALNLVDYLSGRKGFAELRGKGSTVSLLGDVKPEVRTFVKTFNIAGLPILVVLAGLGVWLMWTARKKRIRAQFQAGVESKTGAT